MQKEKLTIKKEEASINISASNIDSMRFNNSIKTGFRVYKDGYIGVSGVVGDYEDENEMYDEAIKNLDNKVSYDLEISKNNCKSITKATLDTTDKEFLENIKELVNELKNKYPAFLFSNKCNMTKLEVSLKNDCGLDLVYSDKVISLGILVKDKASSDVFSTVIGGDARYYNKDEILRDASLQLDNYFNILEIEDGVYPIIIDESEVNAKLINELRSDSIYNKASIFSNLLNEKKFNDNFNMGINTNPDEIEFIPFFDYEGGINDGYYFPLIENGVIKNAYSSKKEAKTYNIPYTASADSDYDSVPLLNDRGAIVIKKNDKSLKEILGVSKAIFVVIASGGDWTTNGDFATPVQLAYLIENGKFIGRINNINISSNIYEMFGKDFLGKANDSLFEYTNTKPLVINMKVTK